MRNGGGGAQNLEAPHDYKVTILLIPSIEHFLLLLASRL